jgi:hypothetical protein
MTRFSTSTRMTVVLVLAANCGADGWFFYGPTGMEHVALLGSGTLPIASKLALGFSI